MSDEIRIKATARTEFGKGAARRIRRAHEIPAVMYGHGAAPVHITLPGHDTLEDADAAPYLNDIVSYQHPDHDTDVWPIKGKPS